MTSIEEADSWIGQTAVDETGEQVGMISQIWVDDTSGQPAWASVTGAAFGAREALVPLAGAVALGGGRQFAYSKEDIVDAPQVAEDGRLDADGKEQLCAHYGTPAADAESPARPASWIDRIEDMTDSAGGSTASPTGSDPSTQEKGRRFRRKPGRADRKADRKGDRKAGGRFGRKAAAPDPSTGDQAMEPDEVPIGR